MADTDSKTNRPCKNCGGIVRNAKGNCVVCARSYRDKWNKSEKGIAWNKSPTRIKARLEARRTQEAKEKDSSRFSSWYKKNKEKVSERYFNNRAHVITQQALYRALNPWKARASDMKYRSTHQDKISLKNATWRKLNPDALSTYRQNRRARTLKAGGTLSRGLSARLFKLQKGKCACCGLPLGTDYHMDHIMPLALGGSNTDDNIQLLRQRCNNQKHSKHPIDFMQSRGFLL